MSRFFASRGDSSATGDFYALFNGQDGLADYSIGAATRTAGTWAEFSGNPVITAGSSGAWDDDHVKDPYLIWDGSQYVCYYAGYDGTTYRIGRATAPAHTGPWTKYFANPVLDVGSGGAFDDAGVNFPTVMYEPEDTGNEWKMWYGGDSGTVQTIGYAHSTDGISWTKSGMVVNVGAGATWDDVGILPGAIYKEAGTYYLYYGGRQSATISYFWQGGLVTFTSPGGTYTKNGSNPRLLARFNDANTSQTPTGNVSAGATTVGLTTPAAFTVGEPVMLVDGLGTRGPEYHYLTVIGGATVTLDRATTEAFQASGGLLRSFAFQSVFPRTILPRTGGGYELMGAMFQPVDDLTVPGSSLWEGAFEWRSSTLTGAWTYYYVSGRGMLFPLTVGAAWHSRSAENPSVIVAP